MVGEEASCVVDCKYINTRVTFRAGDETFTYAFRTIQNPGFYALYKSYEEEEDEEEEKEYSNASFEFEQVGEMEGSDIRASVVRSRNARRTRASRRRRAT